MKRSIIVALAAVAVLGTAVITRVFGSGTGPGAMQELARMRPVRPFAPRMSIPVTYHECTERPTDPADTLSTVPVETCGASDEGSLDTGGLAQLGESTDPDSLQASALAGMIWPERTNPHAPDEPIERLNRALRLSTRQVPLLVDLSAAHLMRAKRTQSQQDLLEALEFAESALALEPRNLMALFNSALAKQAIGLDEVADQAWDAYLAIDSTSAWADEARRRKEGLITRVTEVRGPEPGASAEEIAAFARDFPQEAREHGWNNVLRNWGAATVGGDSTCAASLLDLAEALGRALELRRGGDGSLADAVADIRAAQSDPAATMALARAHREYAAGEAHFQELEHQAAFDAFARVLGARRSSRVLRQWSALYQAGTRFYSDEQREGVQALQALLEDVDGSRHPALMGRGRMMLGGMLHQMGKHAAAREQYAMAVERFGSAGETQYQGGSLSADGEARHAQGDARGGYRSLHRAQQTLRGHRQSIRLHNQLHGLARCALEDGMPRAALAIMDEDLRVARRVGTRLRVFDALQARARARTIVGDADGAARDLDSAVAWSRLLTEEEEVQREWAQASLSTAGSGDVSAEQMDSAVEVLDQNVLWLVPALLQRADLLASRGRVADAIHDLETVVSRTGEPSSPSESALLRVARLEQARSSFDRLVMLNLRMGRPVDALRALERGRLSLAPQWAGQPAPGDGRLTAPAEHVALEYALIGNTLLTWTIRGDTVRVLGQRVDREAFRLTVEQVNAALESATPDAGARQGLRSLYDWLIQPVRGYLGAPETPLVILADGEIAGVPFAALLDSERDRYLVQDHPLRFAATLADAARPRSLRGHTGPPLLVADPRFDSDQYPTLFPLDGARAEVDALLGTYPGAVPLADAAATRAAFVARLREASVVHYAGHALFDDTRPERSFLVLAGADTTGRLTAEAVSGMQLGGVRLVVLSACRTLRSREGRSGGFAGFSGALLRAGAGGVVGSLWEVDDDLTGPLMAAFHREYLESRDPAGALRKAQLEMLDSKEDPRLSSPAVWAGFRYTGAERS